MSWMSSLSDILKHTPSPIPQELESQFNWTQPHSQNNLSSSSHAQFPNSFSVWFAFPVFCSINILSWNTESCVWAAQARQKKPCIPARGDGLLFSTRNCITTMWLHLNTHPVISKWSSIGQQRFSSSGWEHRELHITGRSRGATWHLKQLLL